MQNNENIITFIFYVLAKEGRGQGPIKFHLYVQSITSPLRTGKDYWEHIQIIPKYVGSALNQKTFIRIGYIPSLYLFISPHFLYDIV